MARKKTRKSTEPVPTIRDFIVGMPQIRMGTLLLTKDGSKRKKFLQNSVEFQIAAHFVPSVLVSLASITCETDGQLSIEVRVGRESETGFTIEVENLAGKIPDRAVVTWIAVVQKP